MPRLHKIETPSYLQQKKDTLYSVSFFLEATPRFELGNQGFADPCLTTWLCRRRMEKGAVPGRPFHLERLTRLELATSTLARWRSTR